jgi:hypothetical protein
MRPVEYNPMAIDKAAKKSEDLYVLLLKIFFINYMGKTVKK